MPATPLRGRARALGPVVQVNHTRQVSVAHPERVGPDGPVKRWIGLVGLLVACSSEPEGGPDLGGNHDLGQPDQGVIDGGAADRGPAEPDASGDLDGGADAGEPDSSAADLGPSDAGPEPVGTLSGACGELDDTELLGGAYDFENHLDFTMGYTEADATRLSAGAQEILAEGTAGGSSGLSEAFAFEVLSRCEGASLVKSETEIVYDPVTSKKTDILVEIDGHKIGVSVTRAVGFPRDAPYTVDNALPLIQRKFGDILESSANVVAGDAWVKQVLHVVAYSQAHADAVRAAAAIVDPAVRADTILMVTITDGDDEFIY